jgi:serine/threonine-protein kinase
MSPEQAAADAVDGRSDIYALGCVMYEMLAGAPPFAGSNMQRVMAQHASTPVPSIRLARPAIPESVDQLIAKTLAKSPADRFQSAGKMRNAIDDILEANASGSVAAQSVGSRRPVWVAALVAVILAAVVLFVLREVR